jgi:hypothetical protein
LFTAEDQAFADWRCCSNCVGRLSFESFQEARVMKIPVETKPALWGALGGAIASAIIGFSWGGWVTGGTAEADATQRANAAVVAALAPVCVERFRGSADVAANLAALKKVDSWSQADFIEKGGWAIVPGSKALDQQSAVAKACASLLAPA